MSRRDWEFQFTSAEILEASQIKLDYHEGRLAHWTDEQAKAEQELREKGIDIRSHEVTGGRRAQAVLDPERADWLATCDSKVSDHLSSVKQFRMWFNLMKKNPSETFDLDVNDVQHFGLAGMNEEEE